MATFLTTGSPFCNHCYQIWAQYGNCGYPEKYCHRCGEEKATSMAKPLCLPCFKQVNK